MIHDHHCQCDQCCIARRASRQVQKNTPLPLLIATCTAIWGLVAALAAAIVGIFT